MKKIFALVLVLSMVLTSAAFAETLIVGTNPEFSPFEFVGDDGTITGIDIDLVTLLAEKAGYDVTVEAIDWNGLIPALNSKKVDLLIAGMTITEERAKSVLFSDSYFTATQSIIVKEDSDITCENDMHGKRIAVITGYTGDLYISENFTDSTIEQYNKSMDAVQDLLNGKVDCVVLDELPSKVYVEQGIGVKVLPDRLSNEQYGIAFRLEDTELCAKFNKALAEFLAEEGKLDEIVNAYYIN